VPGSTDFTSCAYALKRWSAGRRGLCDSQSVAQTSFIGAGLRDISAWLLIVKYADITVENIFNINYVELIR
jgi:hypothetical protein